MTAKKRSSTLESIHGFTLLELLIAIIVTSIVGVAIVSNSISQQRAAANVQQVAQMQQQLRGAIYIMERDIRMAGYDPAETRNFGVTDVQRWSVEADQTVAAPDLSIASSPSLTVIEDTNENGALDDIATTYCLYDDNNDTVRDLARETGGVRQLLAESIDAIGFAYAIDNNDDGLLDRTPNGNIIWGVDTNNDNSLDTNIDTDDNGVIDVNDAAGDLFITSADNAAGVIAPPAPLNSIRMVRVWLLARAQARDPKYTDTNQYVVGDRIIAPAIGDQFRRRLMVRSIEFRNAGL